MSILASQGWSAVNVMGGANIPIGGAVTDGADKASMVLATSAALAASPSGRVRGVAISPAGPRQPFSFLQAGSLDPIQVPFVGAGNSTDFIVVDAGGNLVRSASYSSAVIGLAGKDGSVFLELGLGTQIVVQNPGTNLAVVTTTISTGDVITTANDAVFSKVARATASLLQTSNVGFGIALTSATPPLGIVTWAGPGSNVAAATIGLGAGASAYAIVVANRVQRTLTPTAADTVIGFINPNGDLYVMPMKVEGSTLLVGGPGLFAFNDASADCSTQLQAAIDAATIIPGSLNLARGNYIVDVPKGAFLIRKPLQIKRQGAHLRGSYIDTTHIYSDVVAMNNFFISSQDLPFPINATAYSGQPAAIITHSVQAPDDLFMDLRSLGAGCDWHGLTAFSCEMILKVTAIPTDGDNHILVSYGERFSNEGIAGAFGIDFWGSSKPTPTNLLSSITTTGSGTVVLNPAAASPLADGNWHVIEFSWDGTTFREFIDGVIVASAGATGTMVQKDWEGILFGRGAYRYCGKGIQITRVPDCLIASMRISTVARHTANYTPPAVKYAFDSSTLLHCNFDQTDGVHVIMAGRGQPGNSTLFATYYPTLHENPNSVGQTGDQVTLSNLSITSTYGCCVNVDNTPHTYLHDLNLNGRTGLRIEDNSFLSHVESIHFAPSAAGGRMGIFLGDRCYSSIVETVDISSSAFGINSMSSMALGGTNYLLNNRAQLITFQADQLNMYGASQITDEGSTVTGHPVDFCVGLVGMAGATITGIHGGLAEQSVPLMIVDGVHDINAHRNVILSGCALGVVAAQGVVKVMGDVDGGVVVDHCSVVGTNWTWLNTSSTSAASFEVRPLKTRGLLAITITDANYTVTLEQRLYRCLNVSGTLTATRSFFIPVGRNQGEIVIRNLTGQTLSVQPVGGGMTSTNVAAGAARVFTITTNDILPI